MEEQSAEGMAVVILQACARMAPEPWYPSLQGASLPLARPDLDALLDELRMAGLVHLTDWVAGRGQGYTLTAAGTAAIQGGLEAGLAQAAGPVSGQPENTDLRAERLSSWRRGEEVREALTAPAVSKVTNLIIVLNLIVFGVGLVRTLQNNMPIEAFLAGGGQAVGEIIHNTGGIRPTDINPGGQWWRLLTSCFVHFGLLHLGVNMYSLYIVGPLLERMWGRWRFLALYLLAGIGGSSAMVMFADHPQLLGGGASGALWGLMASMGAWVVLNRAFLPEALYRSWLRQLMFVLLLNVVLTYSIPGISASAHFGGGTVGLILSFPLEFIVYGKGWQRLASWLALLAMPAVAALLVAASFSDFKDLSPLTPAEQKMRDQYLPPLQQADEFALDLHFQLARHVLDKDQKALAQEAPKRPEYSFLFQNGQRKCQKTAALLASAEPPSARGQEALLAAQQYLEKNAEFYGELTTALEQPESWTPAKRTEFKEMWRKIQELRRKAETALGNRFDIRGFHDTVLGSGLVPLSTLDRMVKEWAAG